MAEKKQNGEHNTCKIRRMVCTTAAWERIAF